MDRLRAQGRQFARSRSGLSEPSWVAWETSPVDLAYRTRGESTRRDVWQDVNPMETTTRLELPSYQELIYPTIRAVDEFGGSAQAREITAQVLADIAATDEQLSITYENGRAHRNARKGGLTCDDGSHRFRRKCESPPVRGVLHASPRNTGAVGAKARQQLSHRQLQSAQGDGSE
jgi:hypothetical protein